MPSLGNALQELREDRSATQLRLEKLNQAISAIESLSGTGTTGETSRPKRVISAASRRKMALAQKARWAKAKSRAPKPTRTISAAGKKRIAAAQRARGGRYGRGRSRRRVGFKGQSIVHLPRCRFRNSSDRSRACFAATALPHNEREARRTRGVESGCAVPPTQAV
jgi:hypothetical protein